MFRGKKLVLAVTGSIAAYKAADICSFLVKNHARVAVLMTETAKRFIGVATFAGLTGEEPITGLFSGGFPHISAVKDADLAVIVPATANIIGKLSGGIADDIVSTTFLAADCPTIICPAMNEKMWTAKVTQRNIQTLVSLGFEIVGPAKGHLGCGGDGRGRLEDKDVIESAITNRIKHARQLRNKRIMVTAGPTREYFDPVRFISNPSSGKTGYAIAEEIAGRGGETILISGPTALQPSRRLRFIPIETAVEMESAVIANFAAVDAVIMTAAVSDHRFSKTSDKKYDKTELSQEPALERNPDILAGLGKAKKGRILVGFAAHTEDAATHGQAKLTAKNLDLMVSTTVGRNEGFERDEIQAVLIDKHGADDLGLVKKSDLAIKVADRLAVLLKGSNVEI